MTDNRRLPLVSVKAADLLAVRNALIAGDINEAYHQLRMMADPSCDIALHTGDHWTEWEDATGRNGYRGG
jgi:hypothetical protein